MNRAQSLPPRYDLFCSMIEKKRQCKKKRFNSHREKRVALLCLYSRSLKTAESKKKRLPASRLLTRIDLISPRHPAIKALEPSLTSFFSLSLSFPLSSDGLYGVFLLFRIFREPSRGKGRGVRFFSAGSKVWTCARKTFCLCGMEKKKKLIDTLLPRSRDQAGVY